MPEVNILAKLKEREEKLNTRIEKLTSDLANSKLKLRELKKRIRGMERVNKKVAAKRATTKT